MPPGRGGATSSSRLEIPTGPAFLPRRLVHSVPPQSLPPPRPPWLIPALAVGAVAAFAVAGSVFILVARWAYAKATSKPDKTEVAASASAAAPTVVPSSPPSAAPHLTTGAPCVLAGAPHVINPHAMLKQTIEVAITAERLALGFATDEHTGLVVELDPSTMSAVRTAHDRAPDTLRRVIPMVTPGADVSIFLETTRRHTILDDAHPVAANPAFFMGVTHHRLSWTRATAAPSKSLWDLESEAPVDAMHVVPLPDGGYGVAFRPLRQRRPRPTCRPGTAGRGADARRWDARCPRGVGRPAGRDDPVGHPVAPLATGQGARCTQRIPRSGGRRWRPNARARARFAGRRSLRDGLDRGGSRGLPGPRASP